MHARGRESPGSRPHESQAGQGFASSADLFPPLLRNIATGECSQWDVSAPTSTEKKAPCPYNGRTTVHYARLQGEKMTIEKKQSSKTPSEWEPEGRTRGNTPFWSLCLPRVEIVSLVHFQAVPTVYILLIHSPRSWKRCASCRQQGLRGGKDLIPLTPFTSASINPTARSVRFS